MMKLPEKRARGRQSLESQIAYDVELQELAVEMIQLSKDINMNWSTRGWCYYWEGQNLITKDEFARGEKTIIEMRLKGLLPPGLIIEDKHQVQTFKSDCRSPEEFEADCFDGLLEAPNYYKESNLLYDADEVDFWENQESYIQLLVEKSDLVSLFYPICKKYKIPISNLGGTGGTEQKALMAKKFMEMEERGKHPILFTCGDFDPPGLSIHKSLTEWFKEYKLFTGWNPWDLEVIRIGLNYEFILENKLMWIDGLQSGSGLDMADPEHLFNKRNVYDIKGYIEQYGERKCEANAVAAKVKVGRKMLQDKIDEYLGEDAYALYEEEIEAGSNRVIELISDRLAKPETKKEINSKVREMLSSINE